MANNTQPRLMPFFRHEDNDTFSSPYMLEDYFFSTDNHLVEEDSLQNDQGTFDPVESQDASPPACFDPYTFPSPMNSASTGPQNPEYIQQLSPISMLNSPSAPLSPAERRFRQPAQCLTRSSTSSNSPERPTKSKSTRKANASQPSRSRRRPAPSSRRQSTGSTRSHNSDRTTHNMIEKQYRTRLNNQFNALLLTLPSEARAIDGGANGKRASKGEILLLAQRYIRDLEKKAKDLQVGNDELRARTEKLEKVWVMRGLTTSRLPR